MNDQPFSAEQQEYLKGFMSGVEARRGSLGLPLAPEGGGEPRAADPDDPQRAAQDRVIASGGTLAAQEEAKRKRHPLDRMDEVAALAAANKFPKGTDDFLTRFHGLFYVGPTQDAFMCRLRIPGGILSSFQARGVADIAAEFGGGFVDCTTRANLQIRQIGAAHAPEILTRLQDIGLTARGAGADNVRNVTGSPTAGIDVQELLDTRPHARAMHHHILNTRALYGLPRKFNIAFDGGGAVPVLEDTNDISFTAAKLADGSDEIVYRLGLGGITGHRDLARPTGVVVPPGEATSVCDAILRVYIANGDRTNRNRARMKYILDAWGVDKFLAEVETVLGRPLRRVTDDTLMPSAPQDRSGHIGVHAQRQSGLSYVGVLCPVGRITTDRLRGLAAIADKFGSGTLRLTVWQNLLISDIPDDRMPDALAEITALGLGWQASAVRTGLVACTGNAGCKFAAADTKGDGARLVDWLEERITLEQPLNIHLTGCHHSCAQHYIADIGLLGARVERGEEDTVPGYDLHVGGGAGANAGIGRLIAPGVAADILGPTVLGLLRSWVDGRVAPDESFRDYVARHDDTALAAIAGAAA